MFPGTAMKISSAMVALFALVVVAILFSDSQSRNVDTHFARDTLLQQQHKQQQQTAQSTSNEMMYQLPTDLLYHAVPRY